MSPVEFEIQYFKGIECLKKLGGTTEHFVCNVIIFLIPAKSLFISASKIVRASF